MKKEKKSVGSAVLKIIACVLCVIIVLTAIAIIGFSIGENLVFMDFYKNAEKSFKIPGLWSGSVPQGFEYLPEFDTFIYTGYQKDQEGATSVFIMPEHGKGDVREIKLLNSDGTNYTGHAGGITIYGQNTFIAASGGVDIFSTMDILDTNMTATKVGRIETGFNVAFCEVYGNKLFVGNFYRPVDYETPLNHRITTPCGDKNTAVIYEYTLNETGMPKKFIPSLDITFLPDRVYSITDQIQGLAFTNEGEMILSSSYGLAKSHLYVYRVDENAKKGIYNLGGYELELCYLDSSCLTDDIIAPPMAEEIVYIDGDIYIMNESASMKYIFGKFTGGAWCYKYNYK